MKTKPHSLFTATALLCGLSVVSVYAAPKPKETGATTTPSGNNGNSSNNSNSNSNSNSSGTTSSGTTSSGTTSSGTTSSGTTSSGTTSSGTTSSNGNSGNSGNADRGPISLIPAEPVGFLSAYPTKVQSGAYPTLNWRILHPSSFGDVAVIDPPGGLILKEQDIFVSIQPIGTGVTDGNSSIPVSDRLSETRISINGQSYQQLFYGSSADITPQYSLYIKKHNLNDTIDFGGRAVVNNQWGDFYTSNSNNMQVVTLKKGDTLPTTFPLHTSENLAGYLRPFLDGSGRVNVGPMSALVLMELGTTDRTSPAYDYQDQVLLVTVSTQHQNNGHGNNLDGVDSSNPGQGKGGPTGLNNTGQDPSGGVDDERK